MSNTVNLKEAENLINYFIDNNNSLRKAGIKTTSLCLQGPAGIGKSEILRQVAEKREMTYKRVILSQLEEVGDLLGVPVKEYQLSNIETSNNVWVPSDLLAQYTSSGNYTFTGRTRTSYAPPSWMPTDISENGLLINMDDFNRASSPILAALMEIIDRQEFMGWDFPENTHIMLTCNPENGDYNVTSTDVAFKTRMITYDVTFDVNIWAEFAEKEGFKDSCINFALFYPEQLFSNDGVKAVNARSYTTFCNSISSIRDWSSISALDMIKKISKGCFDDENGLIGDLFTEFVHNKYDKLVTPDRMLKADFDEVLNELKENVYVGSDYRADIASVLCTRFTNYVLTLFDKAGGVKSDDVCKRILEFVQNSKDTDNRIFCGDNLFAMCKTLINKYPGRTTKLMMNADIRKKIML